MMKGIKAYLFDGNTVVLNKNDIKGAEDKDFKEVFLCVSDEFIKESYQELVLMGEIDEDEMDI